MVEKRFSSSVCKHSFSPAYAYIKLWAPPLWECMSVCLCLSSGRYPHDRLRNLVWREVYLCHRHHMSIPKQGGGRTDNVCMKPTPGLFLELLLPRGTWWDVLPACDYFQYCSVTIIVFIASTFFNLGDQNFVFEEIHAVSNSEIIRMYDVTHTKPQDIFRAPLYWHRHDVGLNDDSLWR